LRAGFVASADTTLTALADLRIAADDDASAPGPESGRGEWSQRIRELEALLEASNTRALDHLPWLERWVGLDAPAEAAELLRQIESLDFPVALATLRGLEARAFPDTRRGDNGLGRDFP